MLNSASLWSLDISGNGQALHGQVQEAPETLTD